MTFLIADTFTDSLARLTGDEQKAAKTTAFDLQLNPSAPGLSFHKLDRAKDKRFWSVRVNVDIRLIVHRSDAALLLCYVDHHDRAYGWAERRKLETHPATGAAQMIELRESVREIVVPSYVQAPATTKEVHRPLQSMQDQQLLDYGVPAEWLNDVRHADEDGLLALAQHLPAEAMEAVLQLATGGTPETARVATKRETPADAFAHPDAQRRFRVVASVDELAQALDAPWDKWAVFLHPEQRQLVERDYAGPARVAGSAGTGKTIVAIHRAAHLARANSGWRVLLTTFSDPLAQALRANVRRLIGGEPRVGERLEVHALSSLGRRLYQAQIGSARIATDDDVDTLLRASAEAEPAIKVSLSFLRAEWDHVVDAWQLGSWEAYRDVSRLGRRTRLPEARRAELWRIFERTRTALSGKGLITEAAMFEALAAAQAGAPSYDTAVVDEAQDLSITQLRFLAAMTTGRPNGLFLAGDVGQRIFQQPFSWKSLGVDVRGRSKTLRVNYRTSHQIREQADRLLGPEMADVDGDVDGRRHAVSVFNGPAPIVRTFESPDAEVAGLAAWLRTTIEGGTLAREIGVFVRSEAQVERAVAAVVSAGQIANVLDERLTAGRDAVTVAPMHLAKGLEFRSVGVMACDDEVLPQQARIEEVGDGGDLQDVYNTERQLLYVACTRAREGLWVSGVRPESEFLDDLNPADRRV